MRNSLRVQMCVMVALLGACAGEEFVTAVGTGGQAAPISTGGVLAPATGGMTPLSSGGTPVVAGNELPDSTGGVATSTGGTTPSTGGVATSTGGTTPSTGGTASGTGGATETPPDAIDFDALFPPPTPPGERVADPNNPAECPAMAPENPVGDCLGLPVYVGCKYGTYNCVCDWYHWLCAG